jgi:hypothetical protein
VYVKIPEVKTPLMDVFPSVDCSVKFPPVHDHSSVKPNPVVIGVRLHDMETVPAGLLNVEPVMVNVVVVWLTVPALLL